MISGKCQKVVTSRGRVFYGTNLRLGSSDSFCKSYGYENGLYFDCSEQIAAILAPFGPDKKCLCFYNDETIVSNEVVDDSLCGSCIQNNGKYDCLNGNCVDSGVYGTPGKYATLEECQGNCSSNTNSCKPPFKCIDPENFCPPGKVCVPQDEWGQIVGLVQQNVAKHCK